MWSRFFSKINADETLAAPEERPRVFLGFVLFLLAWGMALPRLLSGTSSSGWVAPLWMVVILAGVWMMGTREERRRPMKVQLKNLIKGVLYFILFVFCLS
jgi:small-conductance mechanosensitive channel